MRGINQKQINKTHISLTYKCALLFLFLNVVLLGYPYLTLITWLEGLGPGRIFIKM